MYKIGDKVYNDDVVNDLPVFDPKTVTPVTVGDKVVTQADIESAVAIDPTGFTTAIANLQAKIVDIQAKAQAEVDDINLVQIPAIKQSKADYDAFVATGE